VTGAGRRDPQFRRAVESAALLVPDGIGSAHPDLVLAAFGAGLQELFLARYLEAIDASVGIGVGGTIDYLSGRVRRAPVLLQRAGLEWAWRLGRQPSRLRRQSVLPRFWLLERREAAAIARRASRSPRP
jgi:N-acetylglucosaminyldiphosphoundecaprenol N-acetyl-beta-D-mannosaminyltransferase